MKSLFLLYFIPLVSCGVIHLEDATTPPPPPHPYAFGYAAGRFPGHIDRYHSEVSDGSGVIQGAYSYVDPNFKIRTVEYVADKNGFHPVTNQDSDPLPSDTAAVAAAKRRHLAKYNEIAAAHQLAPEQAHPVDTSAVQYAKYKHLSLYEKIAQEHARLAAELKAASKEEE